MSWQVTAAMTGTANRSHSRSCVCACLRDHWLPGGSRSRSQVVRDQVRARPPHIQRARLQPLLHLLQHAASFSSLTDSHCCRCPSSCHTARHRPPIPRGGYTVIPNSSSITLAAASGCRTPGSAREDPAACGAAGLRPGRPGGPGTGRLWDFCGDLGPHRRCVRHEARSLPAFMQVRGLTSWLPR